MERRSQKQENAPPDFTVKVKVRGKTPEEDVFVPVAAFWDGADGRTGGLDKRVHTLSVTLVDGTNVTVERDPKTGRTSGGFVNMYLRRKG